MRNVTAPDSRKAGDVLPFVIVFSLIEGAFATAALLVSSVFFTSIAQRWVFVLTQYLAAVLVFSAAIWAYGRLKKVSCTRSYFCGVALVYVGFACLIGLTASWLWAWG